MTITISNQAVSATIRALVALKSSLSGIPADVLSPDRNFAINQQIVFHFTAALMRVAPFVSDFTISPVDYYDRPDCELLIQADLTTDRPVSAKIIRSQLESYIADMTLATLLADINPREADIHEASARLTLASFVETLTLHANCRIDSLRIARTI